MKQSAIHHRKKHISKILHIFLISIEIIVASYLLEVKLFTEEKAIAQRSDAAIAQTAKTTERPIIIKEIVIDGNTVFEDRELKLLLGLKVGDEVSLSQLNEFREKIDRHYREKGYLIPI